MSRSGYSDEPEHLELYRANVRRSFESRKGQARLRELIDDLEAMPVKELHADVFAADGRFCALGVWASKRLPRESVDAFEGDDYDTWRLLDRYGWPKLVVFDVVFENDDYRPGRFVYVHGPHVSPFSYYVPDHGPVRYRVEESPAERHARVLRFLKEQIRVEGGA